MNRTTKHLDIRFGDSERDIQLLDIIHMHSGYNTATEYVKAAITYYDKQTRLRPEALAQTTAAVEERKVETNETDLDKMLNIIARC